MFQVFDAVGHGVLLITARGTVMKHGDRLCHVEGIRSEVQARQCATIPLSIG